MRRMKSSKNNSVLSAIVLGIVISILMSLTMGMSSSYLLVKEKADEKTIPFIVGLTQFAASFVSALAAGKFAGKKYAIVCTCSFACYSLLLISMTILFFDSQFNRAGQGIITNVAGALVACACCLIKRRKRVKMK